MGEVPVMNGTNDVMDFMAIGISCCALIENAVSESS